MIIHIDYYKEGEAASCPWFWWIEEDGVNQGYGWASSKKSAFRDACNYYCLLHKWED